MKPIASAVPGAIAAMLRTAPLSRGKVEFAWNAAVGPALQRATSVHLENGVLLVDADPQWAREVTRSIRIILPRLQQLLGGDLITRISVRRR
jgi:hypothetical protein